jgi:hypothetical protein
MTNAALAVVDGEVIPQSALAVASKQQNAAELYRHATDVAGACGEIVKRTAQAIQGRKYVRVEGWQAIATTYGCVASARDVERTETGFRAIGEVRRMSDGMVIATAEGFVGDDESTWNNRPEYAKRAMAQTRSISRACRSAFAFVVVLIDSELSTTPAEEVPDGGFNDANKAMPPPAGVEKLRQQVASKPQPTPPPAAQVTKPGAAPRTHAEVKFRFGNAAKTGGTSFTVTDKDLDWYIAAAQKSVDDPSKARFAEQNLAELNSLQAEAKYRNQ